MANDDYGAAANYANSLVTAPPRPRPTQSLYNPAVANAKANLDAYQASFATQNRARFNGDAQAASAALVNDPEYQRLRGLHQSAQEAHTNGLLTPEYNARQAAATWLGNTAQAVTTDAGSRQTVAQGQFARDFGQGEAFRGQGEAFRGEGKLSTARANDVTAMTPFNQARSTADTNRVNTLTPADAAAQYANARLTDATAGRTTALVPGEVAIQGATVRRSDQLLPGEVAGQQAGARKTGAEAGSIEQDTRLKPDLLKAAQEANRRAQQLQDDKTRAEIAEKSTAFDPLTRTVISRETGLPIGQPAPTLGDTAGGVGSGGGVSNAPPATLYGPGATAVPGAKSSGGGPTIAPPVLNGAPDPAKAAAYLAGTRPAPAATQGPTVFPPGTFGGSGAKGGPTVFPPGTFGGGGAAALAPTAPAAMASPVPQRFKDPTTGLIYEKVGNLLYQVLPNGSRQLIQVK